MCLWVGLVEGSVLVAFVGAKFGFLREISAFFQFTIFVRRILWAFLRHIVLGVYRLREVLLAIHHPHSPPRPPLSFAPAKLYVNHNNFKPQFEHPTNFRSKFWVTILRLTVESTECSFGCRPPSSDFENGIFRIFSKNKCCNFFFLSAFEHTIPQAKLFREFIPVCYCGETASSQNTEKIKKELKKMN